MHNQALHFTARSAPKVKADVMHVERTIVTRTCAKCGAELEAAVATSKFLLYEAVRSSTEQRFQIVVPGTPTSMNPIKAVAQGLSGEPSDRIYDLHPWRCVSCGFVEFYADKP